MYESQFIKKGTRCVFILNLVLDDKCRKVQNMFSINVKNVSLNKRIYRNYLINFSKLLL